MRTFIAKNFMSFGWNEFTEATHLFIQFVTAQWFNSWQLFFFFFFHLKNLMNCALREQKKNNFCNRIKYVYAYIEMKKMYSNLDM